MPYLFISSTGDSAGQSIATWAIGRRLLEKGFTVGFIKPFGTHLIKEKGLWVDEDAFLFKKVFNLTEPMDWICPYPSPEETWGETAHEEFTKEIISRCEELSSRNDIVIILGSRHIFFDNSASHLPDTLLISKLNAACILMNRYRSDATTIYSLLSICSLLQDRMKGVIVNRIPINTLGKVKDELIPDLKRKGIPITTALPEDIALSFRSIKEITHLMSGTILCGDEHIDQPVMNLTVGSADLIDDLRVFKRAYNKIILLGPSFQQEESKANQRKIVGILLTGGVKPAPQMLSAAKKVGLPLVSIKEDTFGALEQLETEGSSLSPEDEFKIRHFTEMIDQEGMLDSLLQTFKLNR